MGSTIYATLHWKFTRLSPTNQEKNLFFSISRFFFYILNKEADNFLNSSNGQDDIKDDVDKMWWIMSSMHYVTQRFFYIISVGSANGDTLFIDKFDFWNEGWSVKIYEPKNSKWKTVFHLYYEYRWRSFCVRICVRKSFQNLLKRAKIGKNAENWI